MHWILLSLIAVNGYRFERIAHLPEGLAGTVAPLLIGDTNHNGLDEFIISMREWRIWEYRPINQYERVYVWPSDHVFPDTFLYPYDIGDIDQDGLSDVCAHYSIIDTGGNPSIPRMAILESRNPKSYPASIVWSDIAAWPVKYTDLDNDGKIEIFCVWFDTIQRDSITLYYTKGRRIYENRGDNSFVEVFSTDDRLCKSSPGTGLYIFGDFDKDGKREFFEAVYDTAGIWECVGNDKYEQVWGDYHHWINVCSVWPGNDTDGDGKPEIFLTSAYFRPSEAVLSMYEMTGDNVYELTCIDTVDLPATFMGAKSACGDVDGDGIEEIIFSTGFQVFVYKAVGDNKYERVWEWWNDMGEYPDIKSASVVCHDFNKNGYEEIIISGEGETSIFEIDTTYGIASKPSILQSPNLSISPNPFKEVASIEYQVASRGPISLEVYDATGRLVKVLKEAYSGQPTAYSIIWKGDDDRGNLLPSGVYFCRLEAGNSTQTKKLILTR